MRKTGLLLSIGFLAGAIFIALSFGFVQKDEHNHTVIRPAVVQADSAPAEATKLNMRNFGPGNFAPLVKKVKPAVLQVLATFEVEVPSFFNDDFFDQFFFNVPRRNEKRKQTSIGSGFFISEDGYALTNNHVVEKALKVTVTTVDEKEFTAKIIGTDPRTDLALLKVDVKNIPFIVLGDSNQIEVGEWVLAIGNPLQQAFSVTAGIISAEGRQLGLSDNSLEDFIQTDAAINRGNSGGPLLNMNGEAIGINSVILSPSGGNIGIGFAIPSSMAKKVVNDLKSKGKVVRGWFGISVRYLSETLAKQYDQPTNGVLVVSVEENSPAEKAGLQRNDLIVELNGNRINAGNELITTIANSSPGEIMKVTLYRNNQKMNISVKVGEAPDSGRSRSVQNERGEEIDLGMTLETNNPSISREYELKTSKGVVITEVDRNGPAFQSGLRGGDVIFQVNRTLITNVDQFFALIKKREPGSSVIIYVDRFGRELAVNFTIPE